MKALELLVPLAGAAVISAFLYEWRRRHNQLKKLQRVCKYCHRANIDREHVPAKLSPDLSGGFVKQLFSQGDYLCQTQVRCRSLDCPGRETYAEKTKPKHWDFWHKISRTGELRKMVPIECLIQDEVVRHIIESRKPKSSKKTVPFKKPPMPTPGTAPHFRGLADVDLKGLKFTRAPDPK